MSQHESITNQVAYDAGRIAGEEAGKKRVWDLMEQAANWYRDQIKSSSELNHDLCYHARLETILYAQQVIKTDHV